jgi:hypothetical protein
MIMEQAPGDMQQLAPLDPKFAQRAIECDEMVVRRLVPADSLGGDDCGEVAL